MVVIGAEFRMMAAGSGEEEHISMDDSDRENFRRRGRSPASRRAGGGGGGDGVEKGRGEEHIATDEFGRIPDRRDNERRERSPGTYRGRRSREGERSEEESARGLERRDNGRRRERSPGWTGGGGRKLGHDVRDRGEEDNKPARGSQWEDNNGRRIRERSPGLRRERVTTRDREQGERQFERGLDRRDNWRRDRSPELSRRGVSREREHRRDNGRRERSLRRSDGGYSRDRANLEKQDDYARGGSGRGGDYRRRERSPALRGKDVRKKNRGDDDDSHESSERGTELKKERIRGSNDGSIETRDHNLEMYSPHGAKESLSPSSEQDMVSTEEQEQGLRNVDSQSRDLMRKSQSHNLREGAVRETSNSGSGQPKSGDDGNSDGEDSPEEGEVGAVKRVKVLSKIATDGHRNAAPDGDVRADAQEFTEAEKDARNRTYLDLENVDSGEESEEDEESDDDRRSRKRKAKRKEKHTKRHGRKHDERSRGRKRKRRRGLSSDSASESEDIASSSGKSEVSESEDETHREKREKKARKHRKKRGEASESSEDELQRGKDKKRRKKRRRKEKERELEKERKRKLKKKRELKEKKLRAELKKKKKEMRSKKPITSSWGKYGIIKDIDMWNKKPEFGAWLAEVKKVDTETLTNWEEKQMFKEYMEDYNTATFPSKKYFNLDIYHRRKEAKAKMKGMAKALVQVERTDFNDEDERRLELQKDREQRKEAELKALMQKMQSGMAQDMKEQAQLREDMQYQYRLGNVEAAQAIQRRLDPDAENK